MNSRNQTRVTARNEEASSGGFVGFIIIIVVVGLLYSILSPIPDSTVAYEDSMAIGKLLPISQDQVNTVGYLAFAFGAGPFIIAIAAGINYWVNAMREQNQEV